MNYKSQIEKTKEEIEVLWEGLADDGTTANGTTDIETVMAFSKNAMEDPNCEVLIGDREVTIIARKKGDENMCTYSWK